METVDVSRLSILSLQYEVISDILILCLEGQKTKVAFVCSVCSDFNRIFWTYTCDRYFHTIHNCKGYKQHNIDKIASSVHSINLSGSFNILDISRLINLTHLNLNFHSKITNTAISGLTNLTHLDLCSNTTITPD